MYLDTIYLLKSLWHHCCPENNAKSMVKHLVCPSKICRLKERRIRRKPLRQFGENEQWNSLAGEKKKVLTWRYLLFYKFALKGKFFTPADAADAADFVYICTAEAVAVMFMD